MVTKEPILQPDIAGRLRFESLLSDLTARFVNLPPAQVGGEITTALRQICEGLQLDRSTLWEFPASDPDAAQLRYHYQVSDAPPIPETADAGELFPWTNDRLRRGKSVVFRRLDDLPEEAARDRESYRKYGTRSVVVLPLQVGERLIGILTFVSLRRERTWPDNVVRRFRLCAQVFADAIDRQRSDLDLAASEERLSLAMDSAGAGLWSMDFENQRVWANPRAYELYQLPAEKELTYESFIEGIHPEDRDAVRHAIEHASCTDAPLFVEFRVVLPDGSLRWLAARGRRQSVPSTGSARLIGLTYDVTERRKNEEALRDLSRRLIRAHEQERSRLARELHDDLTQRLARLAIDLGRIDQGVDGASAAETVRSVRDGLARLSEDVHSLSYRLHPTVLEDLGLAAALKAECERLARQESVAVDVKLQEVPETVPQETALCLFRVAQESLRNVARHAEARTVDLSLRQLEGGLELVVRDDGVGFDPAGQRERGHLGIASMRERVNLLAGELEHDSAPGKGTTVMVWVPLETATS
jgi:PAS domain S-box-containing protein